MRLWTDNAQAGLLSEITNPNEMLPGINTSCSGDPYLIPWQLEDKEWNVVLSA